MKKINLKQFIITRVMLFMVAIASVAGIMASPASAYYWGECPDRAACAWIDVNAGGPMYYWQVAPYNTCIGIGGQWNNAISSVWNRKWDAAWVRFYTLAGCGGFYYTTNYNQMINFTSWPHADSFSALWIQL